MPGSARHCWTASPIAPTFSRPARNRTDSGGRPKNAIGRRKRRKATKLSGGNRENPETGSPPFPPPLGIPPQRRDSHIPTATAAVLILTGRRSKNLTQTTTPQGGPI